VWCSESAFDSGEGQTKKNLAALKMEARPMPDAIRTDRNTGGQQPSGQRKPDQK
jgi:hypothetical protein